MNFLQDAVERSVLNRIFNTVIDLHGVLVHRRAALIALHRFFTHIDTFSRP